MARLRPLYPGAEVVRRDLVADPTLHLSDSHLAVFQGGEVRSSALGEDLAKGRAHVDDLFAADLIVIGAPMYNFSVSSQLKAWIDRVCVAGKTFQYGPNGPEGLVNGKKIYVASTRGGLHTGDSPIAGLDHQESYLRVALGFIGLTDITILRAEGLAKGDALKEHAVANAREQVAALAD